MYPRLTVYLYEQTSKHDSSRVRFGVIYFINAELEHTLLSVVYAYCHFSSHDPSGHGGTIKGMRSPLSLSCPMTLPALHSALLMSKGYLFLLVNKYQLRYQPLQGFF